MRFARGFALHEDGTIPFLHLHSHCTPFARGGGDSHQGLHADLHADLHANLHTNLHADLHVDLHEGFHAHALHKGLHEGAGKGTQAARCPISEPQPHK